jgi:hypothetical protein
MSITSSLEAEEAGDGTGHVREHDGGGEYFDASFVHEHPSIGFLADLFIPESKPGGTGQILVAFNHEVLEKSPFRVALKLPGIRREAVRYVRLSGIVPNNPLVLRVYRSDRLRAHLQPAPGQSQSSFRLGTHYLPWGVMLQESAGIIWEKSWKAIIPSNVPLPATAKWQLRTTKNGQSIIKVRPAVMRDSSRVREFPPVCVPVIPAPAGVASVECVFRVDPDGRFTVWAHHAVDTTKVPEVFIA